MSTTSNDHSAFLYTVHANVYNIVVMQFFFLTSGAFFSPSVIDEDHSLYIKMDGMRELSKELDGK